MNSELTGKIVEWNEARGYGFLEANGKRAFLHINEFAERHKRPAVGDSIQFELGTDAKGRGCAKRAVHVRDGGRFTLGHSLVLVGLLALPGLAAQRLPLHPVLFWGYALVLTLFTYAMYAHDKQLARARAWRLPEAALHLFELLGGWPGGFIAQRRLRHKSAKTSFKFTFWLIVLLHQFVALDLLVDWQLSRTAWEHLSRFATESSWRR
jgi:uncharacterized membrane protein YsdA (DUF1294 family)/cold shock CspA family protein